MTVLDCLTSLRDGLDDGSVVREAGLTVAERRADLDAAIALVEMGRTEPSAA